MSSHEFVVPPASVGLRLDSYLAEQGLPYSRSQLCRRIDAGEVLVDGVVAKPSLRLRSGQRIVFTPPPPTASGDQPEAIPLDIVYEDRHLIVVNKPAGMVVHPAPGHETGTLVNALLHHCGALPLPPAYRPEGADGDAEDDDQPSLSIGGERRPGIVHRLDQDTSGLLVCAKDEPTLIGLQQQIQSRTMSRRYVALVEGVLPERGTFDTRYGRSSRDRKCFTSRGGAKRAVTHYRVLERLPGATLVEVRLETGRTHQIRVHFSDASFPLLGDPLYGRPPRGKLLRELATALGRQALHARRLSFVHPISGALLEHEAPIPADLALVLTRLRQAAADDSASVSAPASR